ncbi:MAG: type VI secretion system baseplate subunit TssG [Ketobacteraceae bacterium]|nr:type VI secretion system baseplate subunit TssG [Ketobacteraceae bacterium]
MEAPSRSTALDIEFERFTQQARKYSFYQANLLLDRFCSMQQGEPVQKRFRGTKSLAFPVADIDSVKRQHTPVGQQIELSVTFLSLYGTGSPLPAYYTERLLHTDDDSEAMREFIDLINHQLIKHLQTLWNKYRYYIQYSEGKDPLSRWIRDMASIPDEPYLESAGLNSAKLMKLAPLLAMKVRNTESLALFLESYFEGLEVRIEECVERAVEIPADQRHAMGMSNATMGMDLVLGDTVQDRMGKFRIHLSEFSRYQPADFSEGGQYHSVLCELVKLYLRDQFEFDIRVHCDPATLGNQSLSSEGAKMGWSAMLGEYDGGLAEEVLVQCA